MTDSVYGPMVSFYDVEVALVNHMDLWGSAYLSGRERLWGLTAGSIARPRSWIIRQTFDALPGEDSTPAVIIVSSATDDIRTHGDNTVDVSLVMSAAVLCHGSEAKYARELAGHYQAAFATMLWHKRSFQVGPSQAHVSDWSGISIEDIPDEQTRTLCAVRLNFIVTVEDFATAAGGPKEVPSEPFDPVPDWPIVINIDPRTEVIP